MKALLLLLPLLTTTSDTGHYPTDNKEVNLPFNQFNALELLAEWKVSTIELPLYFDTESSNLYGEDINQNQVRDDYEKALLETYRSPEYVAMGLLAAKKWERLLDIYSNRLIVDDVSQAKKIFVDIVAINRCYDNLQSIDSTVTSPVLNYFNTDERGIAKKKAEEKLRTIIGGQQITLTVHDQPCTMLSTWLNWALSPKAVIALED